MSKSLLLIAVVFIVSNCATSNPEPEQIQLAQENAAQSETPALAENTEGSQDTELSEDSELVCSKEPVTGSHLTIKRCRTKSQAEDERRRSKAYIERIRTQPITQGDKG